MIENKSKELSFDDLTNIILFFKKVKYRSVQRIVTGLENEISLELAAEYNKQALDNPIKDLRSRLTILINTDSGIIDSPVSEDSLKKIGISSASIGNFDTIKVFQIQRFISWIEDFNTKRIQQTTIIIRGALSLLPPEMGQRIQSIIPKSNPS